MEILESSRKVAERIEMLDDMECICDCAKSVAITPKDSQMCPDQYKNAVDAIAARHQVLPQT